MRWPAPSQSLGLSAIANRSISSCIASACVANRLASPQGTRWPCALVTVSLVFPCPIPDSWPRRSSTGAAPEAANVANFRLDEPALRTKMRLVMGPPHEHETDEPYQRPYTPSWSDLVRRRRPTFVGRPSTSFYRRHCIALANSWMVVPSTTMTKEDEVAR